MGWREEGGVYIDGLVSYYYRSGWGEGDRIYQSCCITYLDLRYVEGGLLAGAGAIAKCLPKQSLCLARPWYACLPSPAFQHEDTSYDSTEYPLSTTLVTMSRILRFSAALKLMRTETASTKGPIRRRCSTQR